MKRAPLEDDRRRAQLLEPIDRHGSIQKAVARFGMSYRSAGGYLRELENAAGFKILEPRPGPGRQAGTRLTPQGRLDEVVERRFTRSFAKK